MIGTAQLDKAIFDITGLIPTFKELDASWEFSLGGNIPLTIGIEKEKNAETPETAIAFSVRLRMLEIVITALKKNADGFEAWISNQSQN